MLVSEAFILLKSSELKQLAIKDDVATVLGYLNFGILELYKRFVLWEAEATITQATGVTLYALDGVDVNVTIDLSDHNLLMIDKVYDEEDLPYILNNEKDPDSLQTPQFHKLKVPLESIIDGYTMNVSYRAAPLFLTAETDTIPLPIQFLEALFLYVGYKGHGSIKSGVKDENNTHYMRFEASCDRIKQEGLFVQKDLVSTKFEDRGFV